MLAKKIHIMLSVIALGAALTACQKKDKNSPGYEYMPDMYRQSSYRANEYNPFLAAAWGQHSSNILPAAGTIAHSFNREMAINFFPYAFPNSPAGRDSAKVFLKSPLEKTEAHKAEGMRLYGIYCSTCHGAAGMGDGPVPKILETRDNLGLKPTPYNAEPISLYTEGELFHITQFGKGNMGSYATQLSAYERWQVVQYVQELQTGGAATAASDSTNTTADTTAAK